VELLDHRLRTGRHSNELVFGRTATLPFVPSTVRRRALKAWKAACLEPISPHECRHTAATEMWAAGFDSTMRLAIIGHSSATMSDHYTHVRREHLREATEQFEAHLATREKVGKTDA
jgi:site-specific recombinase XerD